jgi:hypothetical protein
MKKEARLFLKTLYSLGLTEPTTHYKGYNYLIISNYGINKG